MQLWNFYLIQHGITFNLEWQMAGCVGMAAARSLRIVLFFRCCSIFSSISFASFLGLSLRLANTQPKNRPSLTTPTNKWTFRFYFFSFSIRCVSNCLHLICKPSVWPRRSFFFQVSARFWCWAPLCYTNICASIVSKTRTKYIIE